MYTSIRMNLSRFAQRVRDFPNNQSPDRQRPGRASATDAVVSVSAASLSPQVSRLLSGRPLLPAELRSLDYGTMIDIGGMRGAFVGFQNEARHSEQINVDLLVTRGASTDVGPSLKGNGWTTGWDGDKLLVRVPVIAGSGPQVSAVLNSRWNRFAAPVQGTTSDYSAIATLQGRLNATPWRTQVARPLQAAVEGAALHPAGKAPATPPESWKLGKAPDGTARVAVFVPDGPSAEGAQFCGWKLGDLPSIESNVTAAQFVAMHKMKTSRPIPKSLDGVRGSVRYVSTTWAPERPEDSPEPSRERKTTQIPLERESTRRPVFDRDIAQAALEEMEGWEVADVDAAAPKSTSVVSRDASPSIDLGLADINYVR